MTDARLFLILSAVAVYPVSQLRGRGALLVAAVFCIPFVVPGLLAMIRSFPLRCTVCGQRICVVGAQSDASPTYLARARQQSSMRRVLDFFVPIEPRTGAINCVHCDEEYRVSWSASNPPLQGTRDEAARP